MYSIVHCTLELTDHVLFVWLKLLRAHIQDNFLKIFNIDFMKKMVLQNPFNNEKAML
jgi:hypothetical protein